MHTQRIIVIAGACLLLAISANAADKKPAIKPALASANAIPVKATPHVDPAARAGLGNRADAARHAQAAREAAEIRQATEAMRDMHGARIVDPMNSGLGGRDNGLCLGGPCAQPADAPQQETGRTSGLPMPGLPSNRDKGPGDSGLAPNPEGNLRGHAGGIAGQDSGRRPTRILGQSSETQSTNDGFYYRRTGTTTERGDEMVTERRSPDGSSSYVETTTDTASDTYSHVVIHKDERGNTHKETQSGNIGPEGVPEETGDDHGAAPGSGGGLDESHTIETASKGGGLVPPNYRPRGEGVRNPNRVNPGPEGAMPQPEGPRMLFDKRRLVGDPEAWRQGNGGGFVGRAPENRDQVLPPGPGDIPE